MIIRKVLLFLVISFCAISQILYSQNTKLVFRLSDCESEDVLPNVSIYFIGEMSTDYSFSDVGGIGELNLNIDDLMQHDSISFMVLNYRTKSIFPKVDKDIFEQDTVEICLNRFAFQLHEAIVRAKAKEKEIVYLPDDLRRNEDRDLGDILSNIPGLEVKDGEILYNGRPVSEVLLDGDDFVDAQRMSLLKAISVNRIDSILISKIGEREDDLIQPSNVKLNIKTKDHSKHLPYFSIDIKGGSAYAARGDVIFQPSAKVKSISGFGSNNIGFNLFSYKDFLLSPSHKISATTPYQIGQQLSFVFNNNSRGKKSWNSHVFSSNSKFKIDSSGVVKLFAFGGLKSTQSESNININDSSEFPVEFDLSEQSNDDNENVGFNVDFNKRLGVNIENNIRLSYAYSSRYESVFRKELENGNRSFSAREINSTLLLENTFTWSASKILSPFAHLEVNSFSENHLSRLNYDSIDISVSALQEFSGRNLEWNDSRSFFVFGGFIGSRIVFNRKSNLTAAFYVGQNKMRNEISFNDLIGSRIEKSISQFTSGFSIIYSLSLSNATSITSSAFLPFARVNAFNNAPDFKVNLSVNRKLGSVFKFLQFNGSISRGPLSSSFYASRFDLTSPFIVSYNSFSEIQSSVLCNGSLMLHNLSPNGKFSRFWFLQVRSSPEFANTVISATNRLIELDVNPDNFVRLSMKGGFVMSHSLADNLGNNRLELDVAVSQIPSSSIPVRSELLYEPHLRYKHTFDFTENMSGEVDFNSSFYFLSERDFSSGMSNLEYSMTFRQLTPFVVKISSEGYLFSNPQLNLTSIFNSSSEISTQLGPSNQFELSIVGSLRGRNLGDIFSANVSSYNLSTVEKFNSLPGFVMLGLKYNF